MPRDTALILGASKGLGLEIATACNRQGSRTVEVASSLGSTKTGAYRDESWTAPCDLRSERSVADFLAWMRDQRVAIDRFFWVAGTWWEGEFAEMSPAEMLRMIDVNFRNAMLIAHHVWSRMAISSRAPLSFCVIGSTSGVRPRRDQAVYAATKYAQVGFVESLKEGIQDSRNLRVSLFVLGGMRTHLFDAKPPANYDEFMDPAKVAAHIVRAVAEQRDPYLRQEISRDTPLGQSLR